jgi:hypothetical protein
MRGRGLLNPQTQIDGTVRLRNHLIVLSCRPQAIRQQEVASFFMEPPRFGP